MHRFNTITSQTTAEISIENKHRMNTKKQFLILFLLSGFLFGETGCKVFKRHPHSNGQLISTKPHGRLAEGEKDDMSGSRNENSNEPVKEKKHRRD